MRLATLTLITSLALAALPANAAPSVSEPSVSSAPGTAAVVPVAGGCGPGFYRDRWGECLPFGYGPRYRWRYGHHPRRHYHHRHWRRYY